MQQVTHPPVICVPLHIAHWCLYVPPAEDPIRSIQTVTFRSRTGQITLAVPLAVCTVTITVKAQIALIRVQATLIEIRSRKSVNVKWK
jgi:hypothetical protein